jgi:DNA repair protein RecN (Recombination protein N)
LEDIASGGELSRIMLAIKTVLAGADTVETLVFDEVDTGIGGEVALEVAKFLSKLSKNKQVLCITHLASIAVRADNHLKVEKRVAGDRTVTSVRRVAGADREAEIARMLSGESENETSLSHARELLKKYGNDRGRENGENHE